MNNVQNSSQPSGIGMMKKLRDVELDLKVILAIEGDLHVGVHWKKRYNL